jgi:hypothetical protein
MGKTKFHTKKGLYHSPTFYYHLGCISWEIVPQNWVCEACETRSDHDDDVTLPYMGTQQIWETRLTCHSTSSDAGCVVNACDINVSWEDHERTSREKENNT